MLGGMAEEQMPLPPLPTPRQPFGAYRVALVCLGNICRSPMAESVLQVELARAGLGDAVTADSAGTGDWHIGGPMDGGAQAELARRGQDGARHRARQFQPDWFSRYDLVLAMDRSNLATLLRMSRGSDHHDRVRLFRSFDPAVAAGRWDPYEGEVPDPYGGHAEDYALAYDLILPAARGLASALAGLPGMPTTAAGLPPRQ